MMGDRSSALAYAFSDQEEGPEEQASDRDEFHRVFPPRVIVVRRPMPFLLIRQYARLACAKAVFELTEDGEWEATIPEFSGVWASDEDPDAAKEELQEVVFDWAVLKRRHGDKDLPVVEGIDLNI
jgi:predicted RNase H-like HicB family nuclease